jgi:hypothetical protein
MHAHQDIATPDKLPANIQLRNRWPIAILLDPAPQVLILEYVEGGELARVDALQAEYLDRGAREAALRCLGCALHEEHDRCRGDGFVDGGADLLGQEARLEEGLLYSPRQGARGGGGAEGGERAAECLEREEWVNITSKRACSRVPYGRP